MNKYFFHNLKTVPFHSLDAYSLIYVCNLHILNYHERKQLDLTLVGNVYIFPYSEYISRDILHIFLNIIIRVSFHVVCNAKCKIPVNFLLVLVVGVSNQTIWTVLQFSGC